MAQHYTATPSVDDIDYFTHAELLYDLARQMTQYLLSYLSEDETRQTLVQHRRLTPLRFTPR